MLDLAGSELDKVSSSRRSRCVSRPFWRVKAHLMSGRSLSSYATSLDQLKIAQPENGNGRLRLVCRRLATLMSAQIGGVSVLLEAILGSPNPQGQGGLMTQDRFPMGSSHAHGVMHAAVGISPALKLLD